MVLVNGHLDGLDAPSVSTDDAHAARVAVQHLRSLGHLRVGLAMGPPRYVHSRRKLEGFRKALAEGGLSAEPELVAHSVFSVEGGQAATEALLEQGVTAAVSGSGLRALGAIRAARARGLRCPGTCRRSATTTRCCRPSPTRR